MKARLESQECEGRFARTLSLVKLTVEASGAQATARGGPERSAPGVSGMSCHLWSGASRLGLADILPALWFGCCVLDKPGALRATIQFLLSSIPFLLRLPERRVVLQLRTLDEEQHTLFCAPKSPPKIPLYVMS